MKINYVVLLVGILQIIGGGWAFWTADYKMGIINVGVGIANGTLSTMAK